MAQVASSSQPQVSILPFVEYVLRALEHPPFMFVSKLAACCATLYLAHSDAELLESLVKKWAVRFVADRGRLIQLIRRRARQGKASKALRPCTVCVDVSIDDAAAAADRCDTEVAAGHLLRILDSLVPMYFSWNWHRAEYVILLNKEYEAYVRENILPLCIACDAEDGEDDDESMPWLIPPSVYSTSPTIASPTSPSRQLAAAYGMYGMPRLGPPGVGVVVTAGNSTHFSPHSPPRPYVVGGGAAAGSPHGSIGGSAHVHPPRHALVAQKPAAQPGEAPATSDTTRAQNSPRSTTVISPSALASADTTADLSSTRHGGVSPSRAPGLSRTTTTSSLMTSNLTSTAEGYDETTLTFLTITNYMAALRHNRTGLVTVFHAKYSIKSNKVLQLLQEIIHQEMLDPMPVIAVVYAVAEPELASLYNISWFPTIIYTPPGNGSDEDSGSESDSDEDTTAASSHTSPIVGNEDNNGSRSAGGSNSSSTSKDDDDGDGEEKRRTHGGATRSTSTTATPQASDATPTSGHLAGSPSHTAMAAVTPSRSAASAGCLSPSEMLFGMTMDSATTSATRRVVPPSPVAMTPNGNESGAVAAPVSNSSGLVDCCGTLVAVGPQYDENRALAARIHRDNHRVYPANGAATIAALVGWLQSRGCAEAITEDDKNFIAGVRSFRAAEKLRETRELHSAVVMLRRLQGDEGVRRSTSTETDKSGSHAGSQSPFVSRRSEPPLFIFLGGGMAAGKSTAAAALARSEWWRAHKEQSVLVNADEFKVAEPLYEGVSEDMHARSTRAAESLLVHAVNQGRSIVLDGTMMWAPFVEQVIAMVRKADTTLFQRGPGYQEGNERYFVPVGPRPVPLPVPYRIRFIGITVEPEVAVPRGIMRKFSTGRGVPIEMQLRSFKLFAENFEKYASLVDSVMLLNNNVFVDLKKGELPPVLALRDDTTNGTLRVNDDAVYAQFLRQRTLNEHAGNILELYRPSTEALGQQQHKGADASHPHNGNGNGNGDA